MSRAASLGILAYVLVQLSCIGLIAAGEPMAWWAQICAVAQCALWAIIADRRTP